MSVNEKMTLLADAIRDKSGRTDTLTLDEMTVAVQSIEIGGGGLDVLPTLGFTTQGAYYGKSLGSFGNQKLVTLLTLKKGKSVPAGYFGTIYQKSGGSTVAAWAISNGGFNASRSVMQITPSDYLWVMVGCYPGNQETWDAFMDAFEVRTELICEEL